MKKLTVSRYAKTLMIFMSVCIHCSQIGAQDFQRCFGTPLDNAFTKVIRDGTFYYVLGQEETTNGSEPVATVTRLDINGNFQWTIRATIPSVFNDAVRLANGDLVLVGHTLPFDDNAKSLMGQVTSQFGGNFIWLRTYDEPGRDGFIRIVWNPIPENHSSICMYSVPRHNREARRRPMMSC